MLAQTSGGSVTIDELYLVNKLGRFNLYLAKKDEFADRLGVGKINEQWLWHGTKQSDVKSIVSNGFLRDYNHTSQYGTGTYFAAEAKYSLQTQYAVLDRRQGRTVVTVVTRASGRAVQGQIWNG